MLFGPYCLPGTVLSAGDRKTKNQGWGWGFWKRTERKRIRSGQRSGQCVVEAQDRNIQRLMWTPTRRQPVGACRSEEDVEAEPTGGVCRTEPHGDIDAMKKRSQPTEKPIDKEMNRMAEQLGQAGDYDAMNIWTPTEGCSQRRDACRYALTPSLRLG